ncbi:MAG: hypothetical protein B7733_05865 [Myxococcales bacterium FL481]|nr:MAG: hypothetical protein B7733_05865 [Myxococcales bacterium FL481]
MIQPQPTDPAPTLPNRTDRTVVYLDACTSRELTSQTKVLHYPILDGVASDNIHQGPRRLQLRGVISDTSLHPLAMAEIAAGSLLDSGYGADKAKATLEEMDAKKDLVQVVTPRWTESNMAIQGLRFSEDPNTGRAYRVSITLVHVPILSSKLDLGGLLGLASLTEAEKGARGTSDLGLQAATKVR